MRCGKLPSQCRLKTCPDGPQMPPTKGPSRVSKRKRNAVMLHNPKLEQCVRASGSRRTRDKKEGLSTRKRIQYEQKQDIKRARSGVQIFVVPCVGGERLGGTWAWLPSRHMFKRQARKYSPTPAPIRKTRGNSSVCYDVASDSSLTKRRVLMGSDGELVISDGNTCTHFLFYFSSNHMAT